MSAELWICNRPPVPGIQALDRRRADHGLELRVVVQERNELLLRVQRWAFRIQRQDDLVDSVSRRWRFFMTCSPNFPARSRGTLMRTCRYSRSAPSWAARYVPGRRTGVRLFS